MEWDIDKVLLDLHFFKLRWYGLFFATGVILGARSLPIYLERYKVPRAHASTQTVWALVGMIICAHLVHLIFYEPRSFIDNPIRILEIGSGLASHGGAFGTILGMFLYARRQQVPFHRLADAMMGAGLWVIPWVRIGNFFNSEIYGRETSLPWGVIFKANGFTTPRHPSQLYEALICFCLLGIYLILQRRYRHKLAPGALFYLGLAAYFGSRFLIEYVKEYQALSASFPFTMGQLLSAPVALGCLGMFLFSPYGLRGKADYPEVHPPLTAAQREALKKQDTAPKEQTKDKAAANKAKRKRRKR